MVYYFLTFTLLKQMKKLFVLLTILFFCGVADAQEKKFFDSPFAVGGGFLPSWIIPNFSPINQKLMGFGTSDFSSAGFYASGGAGYVYIGYIPGLRLGGLSIGGSTKQTGTVGAYSTEVTYSSSFGGLTAEYTLPFVRKVAISVGAILGHGTTSLQVSRFQGSFSWDNIWSETPGSGAVNNSYSRTLTNSYFMIAPTLNVDIPVNRLVALRVGAGYSFALTNKWKLENDQEVLGAPNDAKGGGLFITTGVFVGFFSF